MSRRAAGLPVLAVALALSFAPSVARAAAFELNDGSWEGCRELLELAREELGSDRVVVLATLDWEALEKQDGVLVLHPSNAMDVEEAASFMKAGGRFAVADDFGRGDRVLAHFKLHRRSLPNFPERYLRGKPSVAIAVPAREADAPSGGAVHPTVAEVGQVVLNHATAFVHPDLTPVLEVRGSRDGAGAQPEVVSVAVAGQVERGRLFAIGDPSALINLMLRYPGNRAFARGVVRYLANGDPTDPRKGKLYLLANDFAERGSFGGVTPARKALDRRLRALADGIRELRDGGFPWWLHLAVAALCALAAMRWATVTLMRVYAAKLPRYARETAPAAQGGAAGRRAVLASRVASPALALLELKAALGETLAPALGLSGATPPTELVARLAASGGLDEPLLRRTVRALDAMRLAEEEIVSGARSRVTIADVADAASVVRALTAERRP